MKKARTEKTGTKALSKEAAGGPKDKIPTLKSIQKDPSASTVYKSLFTSSNKARNQQSAHWVTYNPFYNWPVTGVGQLTLHCITHGDATWDFKCFFYYHISRNFSESKIKHFNLKIEHQILVRHDFSDFPQVYYKTYYIQAGCIVSNTQFKRAEEPG